MQPYKGLRPYEEPDKDNFFGRESEKRILVNKILTNKLTLLFAASGIGKSSLLQAAVIPYLKAPVGKNLDVVYHNNWFANPSADLKQTLIDYRKDKEIPSHSLELPDFLQFYTIFTSEPLVIILDQFEEFFNYQRYSKHFPPFIEQLTAAILDRNTATVFVISMREDFALELNAFKPAMPTLLFNNFYRLEKLTRQKATQAIVKPLRHFDFSYEPGLLDRLLEDLSQREQIEQAHFSNAADFIEAPDFIEPPHLQIVCTQLWQADQNNPTQQISTATYENGGKALGFLSTYLETQIQQLSPADKKLASLAFNYLVNQHGTKMAYPVGELAQLLDIEEQPLANTLNKLEQARILRKQARQNIMWYELYHDMFARSVYEWNEAYKDQQSYCLHLHSNQEVSDDMELYRGIRQAHYVYETGYYRADIEPDKLFTHKIIPKIKQLNLELLGLLPLAKRIEAYYDDGEITKSLNLANAAISTYDITLSERVIDTLAGFRSVKSHQTLQVRLQSETDARLKRQIIATLGKTQAPFKIIPLLLPFLKDEDSSVRSSAAEALALLGATEAIKPLIELLKDSSKDVCRIAAKGLAQLKAKEAIKPLIELLKNTDTAWYIRSDAAEGLAQMGATEAVKPLIELLKNTEWEMGSGEQDVHDSIRKALIDLGTTEIIKPLIELLKDTKWVVRSSATDSLAQLGAIEAIKPLIKLLKDQQWYVRSKAASALAQLGATEAVTPLIELLKDQQWDVRMDAVSALAQLGATDAIKLLIELLKDPNENVRCSAVSALAQLGATEAVNPLIELFRDTEDDVSKHAVDALVSLEAIEAVKPLIELFKDTDYYVRRKAMFALTHLNATEAIMPLIKLLKDTDSYIRCDAVEKLAQLGATEAIKPLSELLKDTNKDVRNSTTEALAQMGAFEVVQPLIELLKNPNPDIRSSAARGLAQMGSMEAIQPLTELLKDSDSDVRDSAVKALAQLGAAKAVTPLIAFLKDTNWQVRSNAVEALGQLGTIEAIKPLIKLLKDSDKNIFHSATKRLVQFHSNVMETLGQLGTAEAIKPLIELLKDTDSDVRDSAVKALAQLGATETVQPLIENRQNLSQLDTDNDKASRILAKELATLEKKSCHPGAYQRQESAEMLSKLFSKQSVTLLTPLLEDKHLGVKKQTIISMGQIGEKQAELLRPVLSQLCLLLEDSNIHIRREVVTTLGKIAPQLSDEKTVWLERFANIAKNQQELFTIRNMALKALAKIKTDEAAELILTMLQPEQIEQESASFILAVFRVLGDIRSKVALDFLGEQLKDLSERKQTWRKQWELEQTEQQRNAWQYSQWETELGYAIAQIDPDNAGIALLSHDIAEVRKGAWLAMSKVGNVNMIKTLVAKHRDSQPDEAHFRHAAFRAIDKMLITIEVKGNQQDWEVLQALLPSIEHTGIRDRVEWTILCLLQRLDRCSVAHLVSERKVPKS